MGIQVCALEHDCFLQNRKSLRGDQAVLRLAVGRGVSLPQYNTEFQSGPAFEFVSPTDWSFGVGLWPFVFPTEPTAMPLVLYVRFGSPQLVMTAFGDEVEVNLAVFLPTFPTFLAPPIQDFQILSDDLPFVLLDQGVELDCNDNGVPDDIDLALGNSTDTNGNLVPDECEAGAALFARGDCNADTSFDVADAITMLAVLFPGQVPITISCEDSCDCNDDGMLDVADAICILAGIFGAPAVPPRSPHPSCGVDPSADGLGCDSYACP